MIFIFLLLIFLLTILYFIKTDTKFAFAPSINICPKNTQFSNGNCVPYGLALAKLKKPKKPIK